MTMQRGMSMEAFKKKVRSAMIEEYAPEMDKERIDSGLIEFEDILFNCYEDEELDDRHAIDEAADNISMCI